jgi:uncharacterized membrane protein HdeD (DUF308 family)
MDVNKIAGACLIIFGIINVLHEIVVRSTGRSTPGFVYAFVTALLFTFGALLFFRRIIPSKSVRKVKGPSIYKD